VPTALLKPFCQPESLLVSSVPAFVLSEFAGKQYLLLWRASRGGFSAADFHRHCEGYSGAVVLIKDSNGYLFGGYTLVVGAKTGANYPDPSLSTFVFMLMNLHEIAPRPFALRDRNAKLCDLLQFQMWLCVRC
jgi:hypothetical protein